MSHIPRHIGKICRHIGILGQIKIRRHIGRILEFWKKFVVTLAGNPWKALQSAYKSFTSAFIGETNFTYECDGVKTTQKVNVSHPYSMPKSNPNFKMPASANTCDDLVDKTLSGDVR